MDKTLTRFLRTLRGAGVQVSPAETLDAVHAANAVGWHDRRVLKEALSFALAKSERDKALYDVCFDSFFRMPREETRQKERRDQQNDNDALPPLAQELLNGDEAALDARMHQAAAEVDLDQMKYFTQRGLFMQRIMREMGVEALDAAISAAGAPGGEGSGGGGSGGTGAGELLEAREALTDRVRNFVEHRLSLQSPATSRELREDRLRRMRIANLAPRDREQMRQLVAEMARRLAQLHGRRRRKLDRGTLDLRRTLRHGYATDGILFDLHWKRRKREKPKIVVVCDVSGSVAAVAGFLLQFIYSLHDLLGNVRSFAFSGELIDVSEILETKPSDKAAQEIVMQAGGMSTDYGEAWRSLHENWLSTFDRRTVVVVLGDARSNHTDPETRLLREISERTRSILWLNPEAHQLWGTGDSEMMSYKPYCNVLRECGTLDHLQRFVEDLLRISAKVG